MRVLKVTLNSQTSTTSCLYLANELENKRSWALKTDMHLFSNSFLVVTNISLLEVKESIIRKLACFRVLLLCSFWNTFWTRCVKLTNPHEWAERLNSYEMQILWAFFCTALHLLRVGDIPNKYYADYSWISTYCCLPLLLQE